MTAIPAYFVWRPVAGAELALLALVGALGAVGQFCQGRAFAAQDTSALALVLLWTYTAGNRGQRIVFAEKNFRPSSSPLFASIA